jgi:hypothetical protein
VTLIDEEELARLLHEFGDSFEVSNEAQAAILEAVAPEPRERRKKSTPSLSLVPSTRKGKGALVGAVLLLLLAGGITFAVASPKTSVDQASGNSRALPAAPIVGLPSSGAAAGSGTSGGSGTSPGSGALGLSGPGGARSSAKPQVSPNVGESAKVVATGTVDLKVKKGSLQAVLADLTQLAGSYGGFVASTQAQYGNVTPLSAPSATIVLRVPEPLFGSAVSQAQRYGQATSVNSTSTDVTGQYVNLQARITAAQASLNQYLNILKQATTIPNILTVQNQIDSIQSNIEQMQGQLNVLDNETTYGTLTVSLTEPGPAKPRPKPKPKPTPKPSGIDNAWRDGVGGFVSGFEWFIRILGPLLITGLILAGVLFVVRRSWRFARRRTI